MPKILVPITEIDKKGWIVKASRLAQSHLHRDRTRQSGAEQCKLGHEPVILSWRALNE
ncbi:MAG: hypothetical protein ABSF90_02535 [Syntrophobacteraceae bacterium]|jgi:hypothetical protein